jgi:hypothetical protein
MVFDSFQNRTFRVAQSITATRYRNPRRIGIKVMSQHHTWLGRVMTRSFSRYLYFLCSGCGIVVLGFW